MKLYYRRGACSLAPHIALREADLAFDLELVDTKAGTTASGADYRAINPKGAVPALQLDDGQVLTEAAVVLQYIADRRPEKKLAPPSGTMERYRLQEMLNHVSSDLHKGFSPLFNARLSDDVKQIFRELLTPRLALLDQRLEGKPFLLGETFTVADAYLFVVLNWRSRVGIELTPWPRLAAFVERVAARPAVRAAMEAEGLTKK